MNYLAKIAFLSLFCFQSGCYGTNFVELDRGNSFAIIVRFLSPLPTDSSDKNATDSLPDLDKLLYASQYGQYQIPENVIPNANEATYSAMPTSQIQPTAFPDSERNIHCYSTNANKTSLLPSAPAHLVAQQCVNSMAQRCIATLPSPPMIQTCLHNANEEPLASPKSSEVLPIEANNEDTNRNEKKTQRKKAESYKPKKSSIEPGTESALETNIRYVIEKAKEVMVFPDADVEATIATFAELVGLPLDAIERVREAVEKIKPKRIYLLRNSYFN